MEPKMTLSIRKFIELECFFLQKSRIQKNDILIRVKFCSQKVLLKDDWMHKPIRDVKYAHIFTLYQEYN